MAGFLWVSLVNHNKERIIEEHLTINQLTHIRKEKAMENNNEQSFFERTVNSVLLLNILVITNLILLITISASLLRIARLMEYVILGIR